MLANALLGVFLAQLVVVGMEGGFTAQIAYIPVKVSALTRGILAVAVLLGIRAELLLGICFEFCTIRNVSYGARVTACNCCFGEALRHEFWSVGPVFVETGTRGSRLRRILGLTIKIPYYEFFRNPGCIKK